MNHKAQVTLFVILSVVLFIAIIAFFILRPYITSNQSSTGNPEGFLEKCAKDSIQETEGLLFENNLKLNQNFSNFYLYKSEKVPLQCTASEFYTPCIPQEPGIFSSIKKTLENRAMVDLQNCYNQLTQDFESKGYSVSANTLSVDVTLGEDSIKISFEKNFVASRGEYSVSLSRFNFSQPSPLYDIVKTTQAIVNYESTLCEFNDIKWSLAMPKIMISKFVGSDSAKIYILTDRYTEKSIKFAVKTCLLPAGI
jgi:preprotein translocase subunit YajC